MTRSIIFGLLIALIVCQASTFNPNLNGPNYADSFGMVRIIVDDIDK
jgi:hypothetical protein